MPQPKFQAYKDVNGKFRFRLIAPNNKIVAVGEAYETKAGCINGINAIKEYADAPIEDLTTQTYVIEEPPTSIDALDTTLLLEDPLKHLVGTKIRKGTTINFTGKLFKGDKGITGAKIIIYEKDRSFMKDDLMASGTTKSDGTFSIPWQAKEMDWFDNSVEVYAKFGGTSSYKPSKSKLFTFTVIE